MQGFYALLTYIKSLCEVYYGKLFKSFLSFNDCLSARQMSVRKRISFFVQNHVPVIFRTPLLEMEFFKVKLLRKMGRTRRGGAGFCAGQFEAETLNLGFKERFGTKKGL